MWRRRPLRIGLSARIFHPDAGGSVIAMHHAAGYCPGRGIVVEATAPGGVIRVIRWQGRRHDLLWQPVHRQSSRALLPDYFPFLEAFLATVPS